MYRSCSSSPPCVLQDILAMICSVHWCWLKGRDAADINSFVYGVWLSVSSCGDGLALHVKDDSAPAITCLPSGRTLFHGPFFPLFSRKKKRKSRSLLSNPHPVIYNPSPARFLVTLISNQPLLHSVFTVIVDASFSIESLVAASTPSLFFLPGYFRL